MLRAAGQPSLASRVEGLYLGSALGDALGLRSGSSGVLPERSSDGSAHEPLRFGSATQLMLFGTEGLVISGTALEREGLCHPSRDVHHAYLRWLVTQGAPLPPVSFSPEEPLGWLLDAEAMHRRSREGDACVRALSSGVRGTLHQPLALAPDTRLLQRILPAGLLVPGVPPGAEPTEAFHLGCELAALLDSSPAALTAAGALAAIVSALLAGRSPHEALGVADEAAGAAVRSSGPGGVSSILSEALECVLRHEGLEGALRHALGSPEDRAMVAALVGGLLGAHLGVGAVEAAGFGALEGSTLVLAMAGDAVQLVTAREQGFEVGASEGAWRQHYG